MNTGQSGGRAEAKAEAKAAAARAKALRPWFRKKRIMIPLVVVVLGGIIAASGGGGDDKETASGNGADTEQSENPNRSEADLFPDRPDEKDGDKEREVGGAADLSGYTATVTAAQGQQTISDFEDAGYLVAEVTLLNRDASAQPYNTFDWKVITPAGTILDPCFCGDQLGSGDLVEGGTISGKLIFETGNAPGDYYVVYDPDLGGDNRGVWKVTV